MLGAIIFRHTVCSISIFGHQVYGTITHLRACDESVAKNMYCDACCEMHFSPLPLKCNPASALAAGCYLRIGERRRYLEVEVIPGEKVISKTTFPTKTRV